VVFLLMSSLRSPETTVPRNAKAGKGWICGIGKHPFSLFHGASLTILVDSELADSPHVVPNISPHLTSCRHLASSACWRTSTLHLKVV
jgi:hypothetical protein